MGGGCDARLADTNDRGSNDGGPNAGEIAWRQGEALGYPQVAMITPRAAQQDRQVRARMAFIAACGLLAACGAQARPVPSVSSTAKLLAAEDGLRGGGLYLEADTLVSDEESHQVIARGHVVARYRGRILRADEVIYNSQSEIIHATGSVSILNPDGTSQFSQSLNLNKDQSDGLALDFATRLQGDVKIAAARAQRETADVTRLDRVVYTPCLVCADGHSGQPTWSIRSRT